MRTLIHSFETDRLCVRASRPSDAPELFEAVHESIEALEPWLPWATRSLTLAQSHERLLQAEGEFGSGVDLLYLAFEKLSGRFVVSTGLHRIDWSVPKFEIGYWCRTSALGRGYVTETVHALTHLAFESYGAARVEICCAENNLRSLAVAERAGFLLEGILRNERRRQGELGDTRVYAKTTRSPVLSPKLIP
jgi:RimJ/RimL family protein N-acetyltransferase